jgi:hypothetical protein
MTIGALVRHFPRLAPWALLLRRSAAHAPAARASRARYAFAAYAPTHVEKFTGSEAMLPIWMSRRLNMR